MKYRTLGLWGLAITLFCGGWRSSQAQSIEETVQHGIDAYQRADYRAAVGYFESALAMDPRLSLATVTLLGISYDRVGADDKAIQIYERVLDKEYDRVALNLIDLYLKHGRAEDSRTVIRLGIGKFARIPTILKRLAMFVAAAEKMAPSPSDDSLLVEIDKRILGTDPTDVPTCVGFASILIKRENFLLLRELIELFHKSVPGDYQLDVMYGRAMFELANYDSAGAIASRVVRGNPQSSGGLLLLGKIALQKGRVAEARDYFNRALSADPRLAEGFIGIASVCTSLRDTVGAIAAWDKALAIDPTLDRTQYVKLCVRWGRSLLHEGNLPLAILYFSRIDSLMPPDPADDLAIGEAYFVNKNVQGAKSHASRALGVLTRNLDDNPSDLPLYVAICECHIILGEFLGAENDLQRYTIRAGAGNTDFARLRLQSLVKLGINVEDVRMLSSRVFPAADEGDDFVDVNTNVSDTTHPQIVIRNALRTRGMKLIEEATDSMDVSGYAADSSGIVAVYVNGSMARLDPASQDDVEMAGLHGKGVKFEGMARLISGDQDIEVRAVDYRSNMSTVSISTGNGGGAGGTNSLSGKMPRLWAVVVGISRYQKKEMKLDFADRDALLFYGFLKGSSGGRVPDDHIDLLLNGNATRAKILFALHNKLGRAAENDMVLVYFACHGIPDDIGSDVYFMGSDGDPANVVGTGISQSDIYRAIESAHAKKVVLIADACHSGSLGMTTPNVLRRGSSADLTHKLMKEIAEAHQGVAYLLASSASEFSEEGKRWGGGHGLFTYHLVNGLFGAADANHNGVVTVREVLDYVYRQVADDSNGSQHPILQGHFDNNLPLSVVR